MKENKRLQSLDALRGLDMFFIMGGGSLLLALSAFLPDGMHAVAIYLAQEFFDFYKPVETLFGGILKMLPQTLYPSAYWLCYVLVCWGLLYFLYRKKIFLKV